MKDIRKKLRLYRFQIQIMARRNIATWRIIKKITLLAAGSVLIWLLCTYINRGDRNLVIETRRFHNEKGTYDTILTPSIKTETNDAVFKQMYVNELDRLTKGNIRTSVYEDGDDSHIPFVPQPPQKDSYTIVNTISVEDNLYNTEYNTTQTFLTTTDGTIMKRKITQKNRTIGRLINVDAWLKNQAIKQQIDIAKTKLENNIVRNESNIDNKRSTMKTPIIARSASDNSVIKLTRKIPSNIEQKTLVLNRHTMKTSRTLKLPDTNHPQIALISKHITSISSVAAVGDDHCQNVVKWGQRFHANISTYDLPEKSDYSLDDKGQYKIPVKPAIVVLNKANISPLKVILVPFSHADPGYGLTLEQYYSTKTHRTLDNMLIKLSQYPNMTFQWAETVYLERWFRDLNEEKKSLARKLIRNGQLEIVLGGWVMPDEASTHYTSVIDQLIEGHQWLLENLGVKPENAWVNDPFGYSSTLPYLWKSAGMDNLVFLRIHQAIKGTLMKMKSLEFNWRPYWKQNGSSDILSTLMPFTNYWVGDTCGPNREVCLEFVFHKLGEPGERTKKITYVNVAKQAAKLYEQYRITADLYEYNTLYVGIGEDFSFTQPSEWDNTYINYDKLMRYMNSMKEWNINVKFGTLKEYFQSVRSEQSLKKEKDGKEFPTLSGDFFPYSDHHGEYWTGYYTSRPFNKRFSRDVAALTRDAEIFNVVAYSLLNHYGVAYKGYASVASQLQRARREVGIFQHHDGITGTSLPHVLSDFEYRLLVGYMNAQAALKSVLVTLLSRGKYHDYTKLLEERMQVEQQKPSRKFIFDTAGGEHKLIVVNSLPRSRTELMNIYVNSQDFLMKTHDSKYVPLQISILSKHSVNRNKYMTATFPVDIPPFGIQVYTLIPKLKPGINFIAEEHVTQASTANIVLENYYMKLEIDGRTGMMRRVINRDSQVTELSSQFMLYQTNNSGAYIFGPVGEAKAFSTGEPVISVTHGALMSEVKIKSPGFYQSIRLYNTTTIQGQSIHISNEVDIAAVGMRDMEVILRFCSDVNNGHNFYTDQNGYQLIGRKTYTNRPIESNYYPITTMALLEDETKRLTLHAGQPHGAASLQEGCLEVMLDRQMMRDDGRGLGQGIYDNVNTLSEFILQIEHKDTPEPVVEYRYTNPTLSNIIMNERLQNKIKMFSLKDKSLKIVDKIHPVQSELPCDVTLVGLRNLVNNDLKYNGTSLVLHRTSIQCGYQSTESKCVDTKQTVSLKTLFPKLKARITETSLSHLHEKREMGPYEDLSPARMELRSFVVRF